MRHADNPQDIEYILCLSGKDENIGLYRKEFVNTGVITHVIPDNGLIKQVNAAAEQSIGNLIVAVSDDFVCPEHWDTLLFDALSGKSDYLVKTQDGQQPWIVTLPIMDRAYYENRGYIYHPSTKHMFCDTWITHEAHLMGKVVTLPYLFRHNHYTTGINKKDEVNAVNDSSWDDGKKIYLDGMKNNFGVVNPLPVQFPKHHIDWLRGEGVLP